MKEDKPSKISHSDDELGKKGKRTRATTLYPKNSLAEALKLAEAIRDNNAGQPS